MTFLSVIIIAILSFIIGLYIGANLTHHLIKVELEKNMREIENERKTDN